MIATAVRLALHGATADSPLNQISCESDEYIAFEVLGFIGVMAVPVGIPTLSLLLLLKNRDGIRAGPGNPSFDSFEFWSPTINQPSFTGTPWKCCVRSEGRLEYA